MGDDAVSAKRELIDKLAYKKPELLLYPLFTSLYTEIVEQFKETDFKQLNHDLFGLGLTIVEALQKEQLNSKKYVGLCKMLTSYLEPPTVEKALKYVKNLR